MIKIIKQEIEVEEKQERNRILSIFNKKKEFDDEEEYELEKKNDGFEL